MAPEFDVPQCAGALAAIQIGAQRMENRQPELAAIDRGQFMTLQAGVQHQPLETRVPAVALRSFPGDQPEQPFVVVALYAILDAGEHFLAPAE